MHRNWNYVSAIALLIAISLSVTTNLSALSQMSQVLALAPADRKAEAERLLQQGREQYQTSQFEAALKSWQQALIIYQEINDREGEAKGLLNIGLVYQKQGDYPRAINYLQQGLSIARAIKYRLGEAKALGNLGSVFQDMGEYAQAIDYYQQNIAIAREIKNPQSEGIAVGNLGLAYYFLGDTPTAAKNYSQALAILRKIPNRQAEGTLLNNIGLAYSSTGDYPTAVQYYQQALTIVREIKDRQVEGKILGNLGSAYYLLGEYPKAIDYQQQYLAIAREIEDVQSQGVALGNLGVIYGFLENYPKAIDYQQQSLVIARKISDRLGEGVSLNNLGLAFYKSGNLAVAEKSLYEAIKIWEALRNTKFQLQDLSKVSLFDTQKNTYTLLQQVLVAQNKNNTALEISERGRARAFVELLASRLSNNNQAKLPKSLTITEIKQIAKVQNSTLVQYSIIKEEVKVTGKLQFKELELYIWVIKPTGEVTFRKADLKSLWQKDNTNLTQLVDQARLSIGAASSPLQIAIRGKRGIDVLPTKSTNSTQQLQQLHNLLIKPIADILPKNTSERVIFLPQESLYLVPFPALQDENNDYLIKKHTILTAPSIQVLDLTHKQRLNRGTRKVEKGDVLVVGNPTMPKIGLKIGDAPKQLPPLHGAEQEAKSIAALLKTQAFTGNQATETVIVQKMSQARIIHLATHGLFDDFRGLGSAIALAPSSKDDGLLTAEEIFHLRLNADLVVLSACDTGRGEITGDGVVGLSRSLISAGTPSVIVSLWSVGDNSTAFLMNNFYHNLQQNMDKATALRNAMLTTKKKYSSPAQWAAFTLIGEAE
ncbi:MAG: CHAT domain-containing tetratricopeptide repeat protein [Rhizonema sp. NSF051]|nr:CHAT domain-containing tetratricopeptide repeat protein [Rhizonema sp. NSF051]